MFILNMPVAVQRHKRLRRFPNIAAEYFGVWDPAPGGPPAYGMYARNVKGLDPTKCSV